MPFGAGQSPFGQPPRSNTARTVTVYHTIPRNSIKFLFGQPFFSSADLPDLPCPHFNPSSIFYLISVCYYNGFVRFYPIGSVLQYLRIILHSLIPIDILPSEKRSVPRQVFQMIHITQKLPFYRNLPAPIKILLVFLLFLRRLKVLDKTFPNRAKSFVFWHILTCEYIILLPKCKFRCIFPLKCTIIILEISGVNSFSFEMSIISRFFFPFVSPLFQYLSSRRLFSWHVSICIFVIPPR